MVEYLEIFGKKYPVRIGYYVMKKVKEETGKSFQEALEAADEEGNIEIYEIVFYHSVRMGSYAEHGDMDEVEIDRDEVPMLLDACYFEFIELFGSETFFPKKFREMADQNLQSPDKNGKAKKTKRKKSPKKT